MDYYVFLYDLQDDVANFWDCRTAATEGSTSTLKSPHSIIFHNIAIKPLIIKWLIFFLIQNINWYLWLYFQGDSWVGLLEFCVPRQAAWQTNALSLIIIFFNIQQNKWKEKKIELVSIEQKPSISARWLLTQLMGREGSKKVLFTCLS